MKETTGKDLTTHTAIYKRDSDFIKIIRGNISEADFCRYLLDYYIRGQRNDKLDKNIASLTTDPTFEVSGFSEPAKSVYERYLR